MAAKGGYTETGRKIVLGEDGAWEYANPEGQPSIPHDFRKCNWGMSRAQVRNLEKSDLLKDAAAGLVYGGRVSNFPCLIAFHFADDRLVRARYRITSSHDYPTGYMEQFRELTTVLTRKYGSPIHEQEQWRDEHYREDREAWGKAIVLGHLALWSMWETETTEISLMLRGSDQEILLEIEYCSKALADLEETSAAEPDLDEF